MQPLDNFDCWFYVLHMTNLSLRCVSLLPSAPPMFTGSQPWVWWSQQSRDQCCLPARQQSPDLHWWQRHQHPSVGGRLGYLPLLPQLSPSTSLILTVRDQHRLRLQSLLRCLTLLPLGGSNSSVPIHLHAEFDCSDVKWDDEVPCNKVNYLLSCCL